jgi:hypothetical protein
MPNVYTLKSVVDLGDQTVSVTFDVEYRPSVYQVRTGKGPPNIR